MPFLGKTPTKLLDANVNIDGGNIDGTTIGAASTAPATVSTFTSTGIDDNATSTAITIDSSENVNIGAVGTTTLTTLTGPFNGDVVKMDGSSGVSDRHLIFSNSSNSQQWDIDAEGGASSLGVLSFSTNSTERMRIDSSGNVGIGNTPVSKLDVEGEVRVNASADHLKLVNSATTARFDIAFEGGSGADALTFTRAGVGERMRIDASGNVGIGTSNATPSNGEGMCLGSGSTITRLDIRNSTTGDATGDGTSLQLNGNDFTIENREAGYVAFSTSLTERIRIDSSGNVGIGTTSPDEALEVSGNIKLGAESNTTSSLLFERSAATRCTQYVDSSNLFHINAAGQTLFDINGTEAMRIDSSRSVHIGPSANDSQGYTIDLSPDTQKTAGIDVSSASPNVNLDLYAGGSPSNLGGWSGQIRFLTGGSSSLGTERMRIDSSGNVGINTSSPNGPLSIQPNSNGLLTSHGGGRYREFLKAGSGLDTTLRADLSFTSQSSEWDQHIVELYISGGDAVASTQRVGVIKYAVSTLTTMSTPTVLSQDLQGYTLTSSVASGLTLQVTVTATASIDKFVVVAKVYSQESNGAASSLNVV